jgi:hypothetical protein
MVSALTFRFGVTTAVVQVEKESLRFRGFVISNDPWLLVFSIIALLRIAAVMLVYHCISIY